MNPSRNKSMAGAPARETDQGVQASPGALLQAAREKMELSVNDIATRLHLDQRVILALEEDNYRSMPAATYVRGYLRAYAKAVNLDGDTLIRLYDREAPEPPEILPEVKHRTQASSTDKPVKAVTYLITLGLVLLLLIWWQSHYVMDKFSSAATDNTADITDQQTTRQAPAFDYQYTIVHHPAWHSGEGDAGGTAAASPNPAGEGTGEAGGNAASINTTSAGTGEVAGLATASSPGDDGTDEPVGAITAPADAESGVTGEIAPQPGTPASGNILTGQAPAAQKSAPAGENITTTASNGPDYVGMKLSADCWIEIFDATGARIYMNLARAGQEPLVNGTAPFRVILGNAEGAEVTFNGKPFDTKPFAIAGVARFTLGE